VGGQGSGDTLTETLTEPLTCRFVRPGNLDKNIDRELPELVPLADLRQREPCRKPCAEL
jgi:hypothetical protein